MLMESHKIFEIQFSFESEWFVVSNTLEIGNIMSQFNLDLKPSHTKLEDDFR